MSKQIDDDAKQKLKQRFKERRQKLYEDVSRLSDQLLSDTIENMRSVNPRFTPIKADTRDRWIHEIEQYVESVKELLRPKTEVDDGSDTNSVVGRDSR